MQLIGRRRTISEAKCKDLSLPGYQRATCSKITNLRSLGKESNGDRQGQSKASRADYHLDWKVQAGPLLHEHSPVRQRSKFIPQQFHAPVTLQRLGSNPRLENKAGTRSVTGLRSGPKTYDPVLDPDPTLPLVCYQ